MLNSKTVGCFGQVSGLSDLRPLTSDIWPLSFPRPSM